MGHTHRKLVCLLGEDCPFTWTLGACGDDTSVGLLALGLQLLPPHWLSVLSKQAWPPGAWIPASWDWTPGSICLGHMTSFLTYASLPSSRSKPESLSVE